jgi:hypothetical protein
MPFYANYVNHENFMQSKTIGLGVIFQILLAFLILNGYKNVARNQFQIFLFHITFLGSIMYNIFYGNLFFMRFIVYFTYFTPFALALILINWLNNRKYFEFLTIMILLLFFFFFKIFFNDSGCSPYYFN